MRHEAEREEHHEQGEQEDGQRRDIARAFALNPLARQLSGIRPQQRQGAPDTGVEMHDPVQQLFAQVQQAAMDVGRLPAVCAEVAARFGPAVGTGAVGVVLAGLARRLFDRARRQAARDDRARPFDVHSLIPRSLSRRICRPPGVRTSAEMKRGADPAAGASLRSADQPVVSPARPTRWRCGRCGCGRRRPRSSLPRSAALCRS